MFQHPQPFSKPQTAIYRGLNCVEVIKRVEGAMKYPEEIITGIIAKELKLRPEQVTLKASLRSDLGADSLSIIEIAMVLEQTFKINIPDEETRLLTTVENAIKYIQSKCAYLTQRS